jgi:hypothetical protein
MRAASSPVLLVCVLFFGPGSERAQNLNLLFGLGSSGAMFGCDQQVDRMEEHFVPAFGFGRHGLGDAQR